MLPERDKETFGDIVYSGELLARTLIVGVNDQF